ncbi:DNA photolyase, FAD-binding/Cryptochrome [Boletus reticuloceps]|uniref:DNA photolyase, FAD-binding/Cryptochrome n=1 Tax=Boletus reticuloceps TaxID=495285 RepID=A0A8I2YT43_9AGAM|nr:DNA photolyase, FAD-binding/Cryptochrome [Boletus reticuloceps]
MVKVWPAGSAVAQEVGLHSCPPLKLILICNLQILSRFLKTKARTSQLGTTDPLADGAEISNKKSRILMYAEKRDSGDQDTTSRLSPYLAGWRHITTGMYPCDDESSWTEESRCWADNRNRSLGAGAWCVRFLNIEKFTIYDSAWRDFYTNVLANFPRVSMGRPYQEKLANVRWEVNEEHLAAWKQGKTGVPIVDAAMRQLITMGWMHNRMRMIVAMFLTKDLLLDWHLGEQYFMEQLIDGDLASNNGGWQWSASTGVDPAPYFRIFNPYTQSAKADPTGDYIRTYVPELKNLRGPGTHSSYLGKDAGSSNKTELHNPPVKVADKLRYPRPIVVHAEVRERAIRRYQNPGQE